MRQSSRLDVAPALSLCDNGLSQILAMVVEEVRQSVNRDINGAALLYSLLNAPWLRSLLKVYECLQLHLTTRPPAVLNAALPLTREVVMDLRLVPTSPDVRELQRLLMSPHLQALLSAHDMVAQKDYEPVLPPLPGNLPEDEEAMRIVCLVKNKQPLKNLQTLKKRWRDLKKKTKQKLGVSKKLPEVDGVSSCNYGHRQQGASLQGAGVDTSDGALPADDTSAIDEDYGPCGHSDVRRGTRWAPYPPPVPALAYESPSCGRRCWPVDHQQAAGRLRASSLPLSLEDLQSTTSSVASAAEWTPCDMKLLGQKVLSATEMMAENIQENTQALRLLVDVLQRMQGLLLETEPAPSPTTPMGTVPPQAGFRDEERPAGTEQLANGLTTPSPEEWQASDLLTDTNIVALLTQGTPRDGATIKRNEVTGDIVVARIIHGGLADRSGLLHAGDTLVEVNGIGVDGLDPEEVIQILAQSQGTIVFKLIPISDCPVSSQTMLYVRAMASYCPQQDPAIPCADAGVPFRKGDILEVVDQTDMLWWQARKLSDHSTCAGLIPSSNLLRRKQREFWWSQPLQPHTCMKSSSLSPVEEEDDTLPIDERCVETADEEAFESVAWDLLVTMAEDDDDVNITMEPSIQIEERSSKKKMTSLTDSIAESTSLDSTGASVSAAGNPRATTSPATSAARPAATVPWHHRMRRWSGTSGTPKTDIGSLCSWVSPRGLVVGPSGVGVNELRRRLIEINPQMFQGPVPHTTRPPKSYEEVGREYHFVPRETFEQMVYNHRFLEFGQYKGNWYGTSVEAVKVVLDSRKICVIDLEPQVIQGMRTHELKPYIIFIKPPSISQMRQTRRSARIVTEYYTHRPFKEEDLQEMEEAARWTESQYCQFFDHVIVNETLQDACVHLLTAVRRAQDEPQWVPASWLRPESQS